MRQPHPNKQCSYLLCDSYSAFNDNSWKAEQFALEYSEMSTSFPCLVNPHGEREAVVDRRYRTVIIMSLLWPGLVVIVGFALLFVGNKWKSERKQADKTKLVTAEKLEKTWIEEPGKSTV